MSVSVRFKSRKKLDGLDVDARLLSVYDTTPTVSDEAVL
jgi:hypothetical protein